MAQTTAEGRQELLDSLAEATEHLNLALASLGAAYEQLDVQHADELEERLFRPVQLAVGRARRAHSAFAGQHGLPARAFQAPSPGLASIGARTFIDNAATEVGHADHDLAELQDSMLPVEVGDPEIRAALAELRGLIGPVPNVARDVIRTLGR